MGVAYKTGLSGYFAVLQPSQYLELVCASKWCFTDQEIVSFMLYGDGQILGEGYCTNICYANVIKIIRHNYSKKK